LSSSVERLIGRDFIAGVTLSDGRPDADRPQYRPSWAVSTRRQRDEGKHTTQA